MEIVFGDGSEEKRIKLLVVEDFRDVRNVFRIFLGESLGEFEQITTRKNQIRVNSVQKTKKKSNVITTKREKVVRVI